MRWPRPPLVLTALAAASLGCGPAAGTPSQSGRVAQPIAFVGVNVISMEREGLLKDQTVLVNGDRIVTVGPRDTISVPESAARIEGLGRWLIPGLADLHVHLRLDPTQDNPTLLRLFVANGVTTVLSLHGSSDHLDLRKRVLSGELLGPAIFTAGPFISDTPRSSAPEADQVERMVVDQKGAGYDFIKIHGDLPRDAYLRLFAVTRRERMRVVGHAPRNLGVDIMIEQRQDAVAHAEEYLYDTEGSSRGYAEVESRIPDLARRTAAAGTSLITTLTAYRNIGLQLEDIDAVLRRPEVSFVPSAIRHYWQPENNPYIRRASSFSVDGLRARYRVLENLVKGFHDAGVPILAGTDALNPSVVPGFSLHDELQDLVLAGLTPYQALRAATAGAAEFLGGRNEFGTIASGRRADMILLDSNPLSDIKATTRQAGVMLRGRWIPHEEVRGILNALASPPARPAEAL